MPMRAGTDTAQVAVDAIRAHDRRVLLARGWAFLALTDDQGRLPRRRRGQPAGTVRPSGRSEWFLPKRPGFGPGELQLLPAPARRLDDPAGCCPCTTSRASPHPDEACLRVALRLGLR